MYTRLSILSSVSVLALLSAHGVSAQQAYGGIGFESGNVAMTDSVPNNYSGKITVASGILGVGVPVGGSTALRFEGEVGQVLNYSSTYATSVVDSLSRLRLLLAFQTGNATIFAGAGSAVINGLPGGAGLDATAAGTTFGVGVEFPSVAKTRIRLEAIRDQLSFESGSYTWNNTSIRAAAIIPFN